MVSNFFDFNKNCKNFNKMRDTVEQFLEKKPFKVDYKILRCNNDALDEQF